jgi:hypothetical protein
MNCRRCKGLMAFERSYFKGGSHDCYRCPKCGEIVDDVILENRDEDRRQEPTLTETGKGRKIGR